MAIGSLFDAPDLVRQVEAMTTEERDRLPFGAIRVDARGVVTTYTQREAELSGMLDRPALGLALFSQIAPCMDNPGFRGRIEAALRDGTLDLLLEHVGDFADRNRPVAVRAVASPGDPGGFWLFLLRRQPLGHWPSERLTAWPPGAR